MAFNIEKYREISDFIANFDQKKSRKVPKTTIIAISKTKGEQDILDAVNSNILHFGENRVQEALNKFSSIKKKHNNIKLHMVGPLQTNKVKKAINIFDFFHTLDREPLAIQFKKNLELSDGLDKKFFVQINTGQEKQKSGIDPNLAFDFIDYCKIDLKLNIVGLMCIPPINEDPTQHFILLKDIANKKNLNHLSMGMSNDYKIAAANGATYVRIGSKIFGERNK